MGLFIINSGVASALSMLASVIYDSTLSSAGQFNITSIPTTYKRLEIWLFSRSTQASTNPDNIKMTLNSDTGNNYYGLREFITDVARTTAEYTTGVPLVALIPSDSDTAGYFAMTKISIFQNSASAVKPYMADTTTINGAANYALSLNRGTWKNTASAITSILFTADLGVENNFTAGSRCIVLGYS